MRVTPALAIPLVAVLAACGGTSSEAGGPVAATVAAPSAATTAAAAPATTAPAIPKGEWAFAPGAGTKGVANVGSSTSGTTSKTVTRLFVVDAAGGANRSLQYVDGAWQLPVPVGGAAPEGLSWNGRRAVLASTDAPSRFVTFPLAADMSSTAVHAQVIDLGGQGTFRFDALSRDGAWLFLAQSKDAAGNAVDKIRAYDVANRSLLADPVVDKAGGSEAMAGLPVARAFAPDGNAVYTVYEGAEHPFVHGLLTANQISVCIDLPGAPAGSATGTWTIAWKDPGRTLEVTSDRLGKRFVARRPGRLPDAGGDDRRHAGLTAPPTRPRAAPRAADGATAAAAPARRRAASRAA